MPNALPQSSKHSGPTPTNPTQRSDTHVIMFHRAWIAQRTVYIQELCTGFQVGDALPESQSTQTSFAWGSL
jgi:hypothetical protein